MTESVPAYVDMARLCHELCISDRTADAWVQKGILPPPRKRGHKLMWKWAEVEKYMDGDDTDRPDDPAEEVRRATQAALSNN